MPDTIRVVSNRIKFVKEKCILYNTLMKDFLSLGNERNMLQET